ncbi:MAG: aminotransferase class I/II-fold pyridoxal phosphate-dependent enzyme, partial [Nitrospinales bacterium]
MDERREQGLLRELAVSRPCRLNLISNDYFQLRQHPEVIKAAQQSAETYGAGSGASPLLSGFMPCHEQLVKKLCAWKRKSAGLLFNTGFMANQAVIKTLPGKNDLILADKLIHHSVAQSLKQSAAKFKRYPHLDLDQLEELLEKNQKSYETMFVVTETVFSMDGDYPDLKRLADLKQKFPFILILDEAHATGVFGPSGGGLAEEAGILDQVDILVGTLGKSLASMGAYVLTNSSIIKDYLINFSGEFIYSTFISPALVGAASCAIDIVQKSAEQRRHLRSLGKFFREKLA